MVQILQKHQLSVIFGFGFYLDLWTKRHIYYAYALAFSQQSIWRHRATTLSLWCCHFALSSANTTLSLNIHRALFVSLFVEPSSIIILIRIHQSHHIFFNYLAKPFLLLIIHLNVLFSLWLLFLFVSFPVLIYMSSSCSISFDKSSVVVWSLNRVLPFSH